MELASWARQALGFLASFYWRRIEMFHDEKGPIESFTWGRFVIAGKEHKGGEPRIGAGKDIRLIGSKVTPWEERAGHLLSPEMITGVFDGNPEALILGLGANRAVSCPDHVVAWIRERGIPEVILLDTAAACRKYNELHRQGRRVALLAHGTC